MEDQAGPGALFPGGGSAEPPLPGAPCSLPGALHFLQRQWARFTLDRAQWDVERAELQSQILVLQGERRGQENLRKDLLRRIKMLEFSLKHERARFHRLKYGSELNQGDLRPPSYDSDEDEPQSPAANISLRPNWSPGPQLLHKTLQDLGHTDLDVKSNRVRVLLGLSPLSPDQEPDSTNGSKPAPKTSQDSLMETFRIIERATAEFSHEDQDQSTADLMVRRHSSSSSSSSSLSEDPDTEEALRGFDFLSSSEDSAPWEPEPGLDRSWDVDHSLISQLKEQYKRERRGKKGVKRPNRSKLQDMLSNLRDTEEPGPGSRPSLPRFHEQEVGRPDDEAPVFLPSPGKSFILDPMDEAVSLELGLGELAGLTVANEAEGPPYDVSANPGDALKKTWTQKFCLRSHLDSVRAVVFHPIEPVLVTASEDHTLKLWNLHKTAPAKKCAALDMEPIYTFRAHSAAVLCVAMSSSGEQCFSGGADGAIYSWNTPGAGTDPYDAYEPSVLRGALSGHTDAVWGVAYSSAHQRLISCSADGSLRVWDAADTKPSLAVIRPELGVPSSLDLLHSDPALVVSSFSNGTIALFDLETQQQVLNLDHSADSQSTVNKVLSHPSLAVTISAHDDRHVRFFDNNTGKVIHSMVAHLDSVTCLAVDPNGLYLMSGSHDCSVRLWSLDSRTCVQEFTAHRRKFDESIHDVAFHHTMGYICSGGADALAKVYV